jgi:hypothetical protein
VFTLSDARGEEASLSSEVAQIRHEIPSAFVAQSLIGLSTRLQRDKIVGDNHCFYLAQRMIGSHPLRQVHRITKRAALRSSVFPS